ncbi:MAG: sugar transferase [Chloroherpetonaceae bacterium]|nr:sugar transferase [Chloroherpetonaceae bacterium]
MSTVKNYMTTESNIGLLFLQRGDALHQEQLEVTEVKTPLLKRGFDVLVSGTALLVLSPLFLIVAAIIKLSSDGPVFYFSKRVGRGWEIFELIKFRTMFTNAETQLASLKHLNLYSEQNSNNEPSNAFKDESLEIDSQGMIFIQPDGTMIDEKDLTAVRKQAQKEVFFKLKDDPRITPLGRFLRNTSIDELPQLINIFRGDMSLVGNRPLPIYEAEKLTTDDTILRFYAPAGLTGLWQVTKRGKGDMSEEERIALDNHYAKHGSFWFDIKLIFKTIPALFQKENV